MEDQEDYINDAMKMLGAGYEQPTVIIEPPRTITARRDGKMVEIEEPAWVKFSTDFKKELVTLDEYSLKVFIYIGLSVNFKTGEAFPGVRKIAEDTGMDKGTVTKATANLEELGFLTIQKREGNSNIYKPMRYISIGTVRPERTLPSDENTELYGQNVELYGAHEGNLHNKNNKKEQDIFTMFLQNESIVQHIREAQNAFEQSLGFGALPWDSRPEWRKFGKWVVDEYERDPKAFGEYKEWRDGKGKFKGAMTNTAIRRDPQMFLDTGWPTFLAYESMYSDKEMTRLL